MPGFWQLSVRQPLPKALPDEFIFEASVENHDALHASVEDMEGLDDGQEDDLPEPEKLAVVQVIVNQEQPPVPAKFLP